MLQSTLTRPSFSLFWNILILQCSSGFYELLEMFSPLIPLSYLIELAKILTLSQEVMHWISSGFCFNWTAILQGSHVLWLSLVKFFLSIICFALYQLQCWWDSSSFCFCSECITDKPSPTKLSFHHCNCLTVRSSSSLI